MKKSESIVTFIPTLCALSPPQNSSSTSPSSTPTAHRWRHAIATTAISAALLFSPSFHHPVNAAPASQQTSENKPEQRDTEHKIAEEAWKIIDSYFYDPSFHGVDWSAEGKHLESMRLPGRNVTYSAIRKSMLKLEDRYTRFVSPSEMAALRKYDVSGVGLLLTVNENGDFIVSSDPISDTSAGRAGIIRGDIVDAIDGKTVKGTSAFEVAEWMQGKEKSKMIITVRSKGNINLIRNFESNNRLSSVKKSVVIENKLDNNELMGYIRLKDFTASSRNEIGKSLNDLKSKGAKWIVLDLRGNGGGIFEGALEIAGLFQGDGVPMVQVKGRPEAISKNEGLKQEYVSRVVEASKEYEWNNVDVAILMDGMSASSSEVLAGGLHDNCKAAIFGDQSYGKGLIQGVFGLSDGSGVIVTVGEYRTPKGFKIDGIGLQPDKQIPLDGFDKFLKVIGIERVNEKGFNISHEQVKDILRLCHEQQ